MKITCIIVEDEPLALKRTESYVHKTPALELLGSFENALEGLDFLNSNEVDLIFLDIQMDELSGIEFIESAHINGKVIFTTAYEEYAIKGYDLSVLDFLLKPFTYPRFLQAVNKFKKDATPTTNYTFIKSGYQLEKVYFSDIRFIEGMGDYRGIHTKDKKIMTLQTFSELLQILPNDNFKRVHKSYMVSIDKIDSIERNVIVIGRERIPISATYKDDFYRAINVSEK
jgi:DNA-binding LytR/AlgR family response regulator